MSQNKDYGILGFIGVPLFDGKHHLRIGLQVRTYTQEGNDNYINDELVFVGGGSA